MKCNLDCDYCETGLYGGHDNSQLHPKIEDCVKTIDFMFAYINKIMQTRRTNLRHVVLNVYGGESLNHPDILKILNEVRNRYQPYQSLWSLTVGVTTNAIVSKNKFQQIANLVDEFTVSWHSQNTIKQKTLCRNNLLYLKSQNKSVKCVVMMHPKYFEHSQEQIDWCAKNNVRALPKQIDHPPEDDRFYYSPKQVIWFERLFKKNIIPVVDINGQADLASTGRSCCGGRSLCADANYNNLQKFVTNHFKDWYCSVDNFFLYVKQVNGEVYVNKDCKMNYQGTKGPIGNLTDTEKILEQISKTPIIQCANQRCFCGLCAPKAKDLDTFNSIMLKYQVQDLTGKPQAVS